MCTVLWMRSTGSLTVSLAHMVSQTFMFEPPRIPLPDKAVLAATNPLLDRISPFLSRKREKGMFASQHEPASPFNHFRPSSLFARPTRAQHSSGRAGLSSKLARPTPHSPSRREIFPVIVGEAGWPAWRSGTPVSLPPPHGQWAERPRPGSLVLREEGCNVDE